MLMSGARVMTARQIVAKAMATVVEIGKYVVPSSPPYCIEWLWRGPNFRQRTSSRKEAC